MELLTAILLGILLLNAVMVVCVRKLLASCIIFMAESLVMVLLWILLQAPDLAVTEAAVGAGVSSLLFFLTLRRIRALERPANPESPAGAHPLSSPLSKGGVKHG